MMDERAKLRYLVERRLSAKRNHAYTEYLQAVTDFYNLATVLPDGVSANDAALAYEMARTKRRDAHDCYLKAGGVLKAFLEADVK